MISLPIDIINLICEFAASNDQLWYPQFSPKTHKLKWKVNKYFTNFLSQKYIIHKNIIFYNKHIIEGDLLLINSKLFTELIRKHRTVVYQYTNNINKLYIEFDSENEKNKTDKYIYRTFVYMINTNQECYYMVENLTPFGNIYINKSILYLNNTMYGIINWVDLIYNENNLLTINFENF